MPAKKNKKLEVLPSIVVLGSQGAVGCPCLVVGVELQPAGCGFAAYCDGQKHVLAHLQVLASGHDGAVEIVGPIVE